MIVFRVLGGSTVAAGLVAFYVVVMTGFNIWKPRILVIHSFSESSRQVMDVDAGMREKLRLNRLPVSVQWYYLNSDHPDLGAMTNSDITNVKRVVDGFNPSLMILADDQANHVMALAPELKRGRRIFFLGINQSPATFGYTRNSAVAGITNGAPHRSLLELLKHVRGGRNLRITVLGSDTVLGRNLGSGFEKKILGPNRIAGIYYVANWDQWQAIVQRANENSDILVITAVHGLRATGDKRIMGAEEVVQWTEAQTNKVQPIGLIGDYVPLGGSLSLIPSAFYRGSMAMESVLQWSEPSMKNAMPTFRLDDHFDIGLRPDDLTKRGITLPLIYREAARLSNQLYTTESQERGPAED
jgi:hypothetical protein